MREECIYKGNIVKSLVDGARFKIEDIKKDNDVTFVHFRELKTKKLIHVAYERAKFLLFEEVGEL
jgi:hypothetical protein